MKFTEQTSHPRKDMPMKSDICSVWSYDEIKKSGYLGKRQAMYLSIFTEISEPLTHRQATACCENTFDIKLPARNGRIAELENMGFIKKIDIVRCAHTHKMVNRWKWTGRMTPKVKSMHLTECPQCCGKGKIQVPIWE